MLSRTCPQIFTCFGLKLTKIFQIEFMLDEFSLQQVDKPGITDAKKRCPLSHEIFETRKPGFYKKKIQSLNLTQILMLMCDLISCLNQYFADCNK